MQSKTARLGSPPSTRRRSRGSRGGGHFDGLETSGTSEQTPFRGRLEGVSGGRGGGDGGMAAGEGATLRMQIPESGICSPSISEEGVEERVTTHKHATTSWRCGFEWVSALLGRRLRAWDREDVEEFQCSLDELYNGPFCFKYVQVAVYAVPHIIGRKGRVIRKLEQTCGVFLTLRDLGDNSHEMWITGPRPACILVEFAIQLLSSGQHSILTTLSSLNL